MDRYLLSEFALSFARGRNRVNPCSKGTKMSVRLGSSSCRINEFVLSSAEEVSITSTFQVLLFR